MKVIKKQDVSQWSYRYSCTNCDSELEVEAKDLRHQFIDGDPREPGCDKFTTACVVCNYTFPIPSNKIPKLIQLEAKNRTQRYSGSGGYFDR